MSEDITMESAKRTALQMAISDARHRLMVELTEWQSAGAPVLNVMRTIDDLIELHIEWARLCLETKNPSCGGAS